MKSTFAGFSEEDLERIKSRTSGFSNDSAVSDNLRKFGRIAEQRRDRKKPNNNIKLSTVQSPSADEVTDSINFDKCKLNLIRPMSPMKNVSDDVKGENTHSKIDIEKNIVALTETKQNQSNFNEDTLAMERNNSDQVEEFDDICRKSSITAPDLVKALNSCSEGTADVKMNIEELQLKQKLMEEQNRKRKEMLSKALADRTRQTEEEVLKLEKIKKELQVLDCQFSQDVGVLRKKIDQACLSYADAEKHYLKIEKDFLQAKINLQKEREKKELLTEHLCALITHNETRKAQKLETLMLELATERKPSVSESNAVASSDSDVTSAKNDLTSPNNIEISSDEETIVIDGVCQKTENDVMAIPGK